MVMSSAYVVTWMSRGGVPLRGWKTRPEKERRGRPNRHHSIPAPRERGLIQISLFSNTITLCYTMKPLSQATYYHNTEQKKKK